MNFNMTLTVLNLHQKTDPKVQKILKVKVTTTRSKVKSGSHHDAAHLQPLTNVPTKHQLPNTLQFQRYRPDKILWVKVTMARSKVKSRSDHDIAHLHLLINVPTKYQLPTPYSFRDIARTRFYRSRSLRQCQRSNQGHTMTLHMTYTS